MQLKRNKDLEFETLKKSHKKQIIAGALAICIVGGALTFVTSKAKYKLTQDIPLVRGTVNYKVPDLRIVALYTANENGDYVEANDIPTSGYELNQEKSMCKVYDGTTTIENAPKDNNVTINYHDGVIGFDNISKKNTRCYLYFDKYVPTSEDTLARLNITSNEGTPDFSKVATTNEGVFKTEDGMYGGYSYYWRGAVTNNYVKFANFCWRIIRINGDGSIRLIYDGTSCHTNGTNTVENLAVISQQYNTSGSRGEEVGYTYTTNIQRPVDNYDANSSNLKNQIDNWYSDNLTSYDNKIAEGKYCNDRNVATGYTWVSFGNLCQYAAYERLTTNKTPTFYCLQEDTYKLKIGTITADEVSYAGGVWGLQNTSYYLYNGKTYWTMSPYCTNSPYMLSVYDNGKLEWLLVRSSTGNIRPVINLRPDVTFSSGNGSQSMPYVVN